jgi:hypothetical protein
MSITIYPVSGKYGVQTRTIDGMIVITLVIYDIQANPTMRTVCQGNHYQWRSEATEE